MSKINLIKFAKIFCILFIFLKKINANPFKNELPSANLKTEHKTDFSSDQAKEILRYAKTADILSNMNMKIDPCDDFYTYACGNWHYGNPAQLLGNLMTDRFQEISKAFNRRLDKLLNEPEDHNELGNIVKTFYRACEIVESDKMAYEISLRNVYKEFGEFPVLIGKNWNETNFKWWETIAKIQHKYGQHILLAVDIMGDIKNKSKTRMYLGPPDYDMSQGTKLVNLLQEIQLIMELKTHLGINSELAEKTAKELIAFERKLSQCGTDSRLGSTIEDLMSLQSVDTVSATYNEFLDVKRFLKLILDNEPPESIYVFDEKYLHNALNITESTPKHIVANYILWKLLQNFVVDNDNKKDITSWCLKKTKKYFGKYVDNWVYSHYRNEEAENEIFEVFEDLRSTFRDELRGNKFDWISNSTREYAITKLDAMELIINSYEDENFTEYFSTLDKLDPYNYIKNVQNVLMLESQKTIERLTEVNTTTPLDPAILTFTPAYNIIENNIKIPVSFLQPRHFWSNDYPKAIRYATLGYLIAHEMIHGFDDEGRKFGKDGNEYAWWDPKSIYGFEERRKCFQAQYHNYKYGGKALPESVSQSENIADNAGVKLAYAAYKRWLNKQKLNDREIESKEILPNLDLNNHQLFFISFAQVWCEDVQSFFKSTVASADSHAPGMYRVIGSLSNFQEFSWVFKCKQDAKMDPEYKCFIY